MNANTLLGLIAAAFLLMGLGALWRPVLVTAQFGIPSLTRDGRNEVRAVYGGFGIAMALVLLAAMQHAELRAGISMAVGAALLGMAAGRIISLGIDRGIGRWPALYLGIEALSGGWLMRVALTH